MKQYIQTFGGDPFWLDDPQNSEVRVETIAHALSQLCRFSGHTRHFYSVAQHSVMVAQLVPRDEALDGLLHDAHEAFVGDVASPLKALLPDYQELERKVQTAVRRALGASTRMSRNVYHADMRALATERRDLMPNNDGPWPCLLGVEPRARKIRPWSPEQAKAAFLSTYHAIKNGEDISL